MITRFGLIVALFLAPQVCLSQSDPSQLAREAAEQLSAAALALEAAETATDRVSALTQTIRAYENGLDALREGLRRATVREAAIRAEFDSESERVSQLLGVLLGIQSTSGPLVLLHPAGPVGTARSGMIVSEIAPALQRDADVLRQKLEELVLLRTLQQSAADTMDQGLQGVQRARTELSKAVSNRTDLPVRFLSDPADLQRLIDSAETLEGFASGLSGMAVGVDPSDAVRDFSAAKGTLPLPVSGTVLRHWGEADAAGVKRPGWLIVTRPLTLVTAPWPATIRYIGPLLDYGNVIILEPDAGTLMVLAGLEEVYGELGQVVPAGTPLGLMGGVEPDKDRFLLNAMNGSGSEQTETLYMELRLGTEPVDPAEWFAETKE
jgi:septal ring factor EnvC (AmiA/AmiB activator)